MVDDTYLVTSYNGLYKFSNKSSTLLRAGAYFGLASSGNGNNSNTWYIFHFPYEKSEKYKKSFNRGLIASFKWIENEIHDWKIEFEGVDNGTHTIIVYKDTLYCLETYQQCVLVLNIREDSSLSYANRIYFKDITTKEPIYVSMYLNVTSDDFLARLQQNDEYCHMNAITVQDDLIYINCPLGICKNTIRVYDMNFVYLWSIEIPKEYFFCHDLVFVGSKIYLTATPNHVLSYDIVQKTFNVELQLPTSSNPRGLSILQDGKMIVGLRYQLRGQSDRNIMVHHHGESCEIEGNFKSNCIACTNKEIDYVHVNSVLRTPFVKRLPSLPNYMTPLYESIDSFRKVAKEYMRAHPSIHRNTRDEIQEYIWNFSDFSNFDNIVASSFSPSSNSNIRKKLNLIDIADPCHHSLLTSIPRIYDNVVKNMGLNGCLTGRYFVYGPETFLKWHTNLDRCENQNQLRIYHVLTKYNNVSWFLYRHPISHQIHALPDIDSFTNVFSLGTYTMPLWHAVINPSDENYRVSMGFSLHPFDIKNVI